MTPARAAVCAALLLAAGACAKTGAAGKAQTQGQAQAQTQAQTQTQAPPEVDKAFGDKVHAYLLAHPEVILEMQDAYTRKQMTAEANQVQSHLTALHQQIFDDPRDPTVGPRDAKVTVVEFFDYRCPHCKDAAPDVLRLVRTYPDVRFVFKEMPIFGAPSRAAASVALAANRQGKYLPVYQALMEDHEVSPELVNQILAQNGLNPARTLEELSDPKIAMQIADVARLATNLGISGTPGFLINDHYVAGADIEQVSKLIDEQRNAQRSAGQARQG